METHPQRGLGRGRGWRGSPDPKGDQQREGPRGRRQVRGAETATGEADADTPPPRRRREEGGARGAGPNGPTQQRRSRSSRALPSASPSRRPARSRVEQEPMSWRA